MKLKSYTKCLKLQRLFMILRICQNQKLTALFKPTNPDMMNSEECLLNLKSSVQVLSLRRSTKQLYQQFGCLLASYSDVNNFDDIMSSSTLISYPLTER